MLDLNVVAKLYISMDVESSSSRDLRIALKGGKNGNKEKREKTACTPAK